MIKGSVSLMHDFCSAQAVFKVSILRGGQLSAVDPLGSFHDPLECNCQFPYQTEMLLLSMLSIGQQQKSTWN